MTYHIRLDNFEGPLDLLLFFIRRDELNIMDIPIAYITKEYLDYIETLHSLNISISGEFITMAATLMRIKVRMLLPQTEANENEEFEDPRTELARRLLEYQQFKYAAENLSVMIREHNRLYPRSMKPEKDYKEEPSIYLEDVSIFELVGMFKTLLEQIHDELPYEVEREKIHIKEQIAFILAKFIKKSYLSFSELSPSLTSRHKVIITFLAVLDMIRNGQIRVRQKSVFEDFVMERIEA